MIKINDKFKVEIAPLTEEEYSGLEASILADGCRDAIITWNDYIVDGHNRYEICTKHNISYSTIEKEFEDESAVLAWINKNQLSRRNLSDYQRIKLALRYKELLAKKAKERMLAGVKSEDSNPVKISTQGSKATKTRDKIAEIAGVSGFLVERVKKIEAKATPELKEKLREKKITIEKAYKEVQSTEKKEVRKQLAEEAKDIQISIDLRHGDFETMLADIPDGSVDCIITDPPYPYEFIECWSKLSVFAKKKLKPNGFCIAYSGQFYLPEVMERMSENLDYYWTFCLYHEGQTQIVNGVNLMCRWKPVLIFQNGKKKISNTFQDYFISEAREKDGHDWQQGLSGVKYIIEHFTKPNDLIVEPFAGVGTTIIGCLELSRRIIAAEIDEETYNLAKKRIDDYDKRSVNK